MKVIKLTEEEAAEAKSLREQCIEAERLYDVARHHLDDSSQRFKDYRQKLAEIHGLRKGNEDFSDDDLYLTGWAADSRS